MQDFSISQLDTYFQIHSISEKNQNFSTFADPHFFFKNDAPIPDFGFPYIYAGGTIKYSLSTTFHTNNLPYFLLMYITEGECRFRTREYSVSSGKDSLLFLRPDTTLQFDTLRTPFSCKLYVLNGSIPEACHKRLVSGKENNRDFFHLDNIQSDYIHNNLLQIDHLLKNPFDDSVFYIAKFLQDILTECIHNQSVVSEGHPSVPSHVLRMLYIFEQNYMDTLTLDNLEAEIGISKYRLCRDFSKCMNKSPLQYLNQKRINVAKELLKQSDMTIHAIGASVGIPNTNHFINLFQRDTGVTPLQFRNTYKHALL